MKMKPGDIIRSLNSKDQKLLNEIFNVEKRMLHHSEIKPNSGVEKEIIDNIVKLIDMEVEDVN
jgi:hypothetical protein